jgi:hypothetical protein
VCSREPEEELDRSRDHARHQGPLFLMLVLSGGGDGGVRIGWRASRAVKLGGVVDGLAGVTVWP